MKSFSFQKLQKMPKWENTLLDWIQKNMLFLAAGLLTILALYLRKTAVWWTGEDILDYFNGHTNHTESLFYYLLLKGVGYFPIPPLHSFKWIGGLSDFVLAVLCAKIGGEKSRLKQYTIYTVCLFSPIVFMRGIIWGQPDSAALSLLLIAYLFSEQSQKKGTGCLHVLSVVLTGISLSLTPCLIIIFLLYQAAAYQQKVHKGEKKACRIIWMTTAGVFVMMFFILTGSSLLQQTSWQEGLHSILRFGTYHPLTGLKYEAPGEWLIQMLILFGLPVSIFSILYCARKKDKITLLLTVMIHFVVTLLYGNALFY